MVHLAQKQNYEQEWTKGAKGEKGGKVRKRSGPLANWENDQLISCILIVWKTRKRYKSNCGFQYIFVKEMPWKVRKTGTQDTWTAHVNRQCETEWQRTAFFCGEELKNQESGIWETTGIRWPPTGKWRDLEVRVKIWVKQHSYLLKDTIIEVEAEPLPLEGIPPSECWNLVRNHILKALS